MILLRVLTIISILAVSQIASAFSAHSRENVAIYWGQNTLGTITNKTSTEGNLTDYCLSDSVNIVLLSFLDVFPGNDSIPTLTIHNTQYSKEYQQELTTLAKEIEKCQKHDKIVMLSLGGEGNKYGFKDDNEAKDFAETLWQMFGDANSTKQVRPFGNVKVDGFDLDIETNSTTGFETLATSLREKFEGASKKYYLSAAPQCPYPEKALGGTLNNTYLDFAFIQFYNNKLNCDANTEHFNWNTWAQYAQDTSVNKDIKLFMGIPGSAESAVSGYFDDEKLLKQKIELASTNATFGGVMVWDASTAQNNTKIKGESYLKVVKDSLAKDLSKNWYANGTYGKAQSGASILNVRLYNIIIAGLMIIGASLF